MLVFSEKNFLILILLIFLGLIIYKSYFKLKVKLGSRRGILKFQKVTYKKKKNVSRQSKQKKKVRFDLTKTKVFRYPAGY